jgi:hypothetical protein
MNVAAFFYGLYLEILYCFYTNFILFLYHFFSKTTFMLSYCEIHRGKDAKAFY